MHSLSEPPQNEMIISIVTLISLSPPPPSVPITNEGSLVSSQTNLSTIRRQFKGVF